MTSRITLVFSLLAVACADPSLDAAKVTALPLITDAIDQARLMASVNALVAEHDQDTPDSCAMLDLDAIDQERRPVCHLTRKRARAWLRAQFKALGLPVRLQVTDDPNFPTTNVIAEHRGVTRPDEIVLVAAHYDAFFSGADDNSSGVAAVVELARVLSQRRFARTIRFVGFDLEELGLVGSTRYVASAKRDDIEAALVFDCIGYSDSAPGSQKAILGLPVPSEGNFIGVIANDASREHARDLRLLGEKFAFVPARAVLAPAEGGFPQTGNLMRSDHAPFWLGGRTALFLTDTANFRNPHYHRDTDTADKLDPRFLEGVTKLSAAALAYWAEPL